MTSADARIPSTPPPAAAPRLAPLSVVVLGDSVPAGSACGCRPFGAVVAQSVTGSLTNEAVPGLTSAGLLDQLRTPRTAKSLRTADIVTVTIGANDFDESLADDPGCLDLHCYTDEIDSITTEMGAVVQVIAKLVPARATVVVTGYWNVFLDGRVAARRGSTYVAISKALTLRANAILARAAASSGLSYADLFTLFKGNGTRDDTTLLAADGDHPNTAGHRLIAQAVSANLPNR